MDQILFSAKISFRGLDRRVTEKHLDLLKFTTGCPAQLGAGASPMPHAA
jgi:hypothetical protein